MNVGLVARADDRGIGMLTWEFARNMGPTRTLVVREPGAERRGFTPHVDRYRDASVVHFDLERGQLPERCCREFLDGLDVVYLVETPYDFRFFEWARDARCATVLHAMPEFWRWHGPDVERPDTWWLPTTWRADVLPFECRIIEVPVAAASSIVVEPQSHDQPVFVHVAGHRALGDRNGTLQLMQAVRSMRSECTLRIVTQDRNLPRARPVRGTAVTVDLVTGGYPDRWSLFDGADALVMPRRYGGLCLPVLEAMACGLGVVMSDVEPQRSTWPIVRVPSVQHRSVEMACGPVPLWNADPRELAKALDTLATDPAALARAQAHARSFAALHSWAALRGDYVRELERAADLVAS